MLVLKELVGLFYKNIGFVVIKVWFDSDWDFFVVALV